MGLGSNFMVTYEANQQRLDNFFECKKKLNQNLSFFSAIDTVSHFSFYKKIALENNLISKDWIQKIESTNLNINPAKKGKGSIGCDLSHIFLWLNIIHSSAQDSDIFMILEDDVRFELEFLEEVDLCKSCMKRTGSDFLTFYCHPNFHREQFSMNNFVEKDIYRMIPQWGTIGYLISKRGCKNLINFLPMNDPVDIFIGSFASQLYALTLKTNNFYTLGAKDANDENSCFGSIIWNKP